MQILRRPPAFESVMKLQVQSFFRPKCAQTSGSWLNFVEIFSIMR